ncbi:MAG: pyridoxal phosphate-dependent decarboxylase family protein [Candidatus Nanopelagicales bacterium]
MGFPSRGMTAEEVAGELRSLRADDPPIHGGRVLAYVYDAGDAAATRAGLEALAAFGEVNALDPTTFPSVARIENDLVGWGLDLMRAPAEAAGVVSSGGTESCILAVLAAREKWRRQGGEGTPSIIAADTVHPAFHKAAHLLGLTVRTIPVDRGTLTLRGADVAAVLKESASDVALVVVSAPSYPHGVVDDVAGVARAAAERGVPCHVDACIGGFSLAYARMDGAVVPPMDFTIPGVSSVAFDLHKYGFSPKGASLLLFRDTDYRSGIYYTFSAWPGYPVVNTTLQSTKSAGPMAAGWAVAHALGHEGYTEALRRAREATERIVDAIDTMPGLRVLGTPETSLIAITGAGDAPVDPFRLADAMRARGWTLQPQPSLGDLPRTLHLTVQPVSLDSVDHFIADLQASAAEVSGLPWVDVSADIEAAFADLPDLTAGEGLPEAMASVHALIDALPPEIRDPALSAIFSALFTARRD